jgi:hypothetical protein
MLEGVWLFQIDSNEFKTWYCQIIETEMSKYEISENEKHILVKYFLEDFLSMVVYNPCYLPIYNIN